ncbi:outer membrane protein [Filimonas lacunae]|uniref:Outer membrane protein n=1 Tax=Filimonas lacunae TaxID=477680 RepID=A0A173MQL1_9BACT|nr:OmpW family outer membrane protein [Filimonas lacunae]BAV09953.1 outer membrane protein W precursor [Filimonas lacunae]SIS81605.1 outer membrane protein [Filimonas lacunae]
MKKLFIVGCLLASSFHVFSQKSNEWRVRLRGLGIAPQESAKIGVIGGDINISTAYIPELDFTYFFTKNMAAELILGTSKHNLHTTGSDLSAIGGPNKANVDLGSVWLLPPTLTVQYHLPFKCGLKPYVGAGVNYTIFYSKNSGSVVKNISYENKFGFATQLGIDYDISKKLYLNIDIKKIFLKTNATVDASNLTPAESPELSPVLAGIGADTKINPWVVGIGIGYKF